MKKVSLRVMAAMAMGLAVAGCSHDSDSYMPSSEEQLANATEKLGVEVDPNQDWNMTGTAKASITVNGEYGETYIVKILANDPLVDGFSYVLAEGEIANGETFASEFEYASADKSLVVALTNHNGYTTYRSLPVVDGVMEATIGAAQAAGTRGALRSQAEPSVGHITIPGAAYVNEYLEGAKEPTDANTTHNANNEQEGHWVTTAATLPGFGWQGDAGNYFLGWYPAGVSQENKDWFDANCRTFAETQKPENGTEEEKNTYIDAFMEVYNKLQATDRLSWINIWTEPKKGETYWEEGTPDEDWVLKFKIETGKSWDKIIAVLATEGLTDGVANGCERTIVVKGTWNLNESQRVGSRGQIIIADGGVLNIDEGKTLEMVNQSRLVVMPGGTIQGKGNIMVSNGNEEGFENYNGGTINVGTFNNNFGKFYNYNTFKCYTYEAGGQESNFYNHGVVNIDNGGTDKQAYKSTNARIYNACQWYCKNSMRAYIIEMTAGSYFYVGDQLQMSCGNDGSNDPTYVAMAAGALMQVGDLYNNGTTWVGPTSGYAVVETGGVSYLNWQPGTPIPANGGYMINNIAISVDDPTIGQGQGQGTDTYVALRDYILNGYGATGNVFDPRGKEPAPEGNNGAVLVEKGGANVNIPSSDDFVAGEKGCTPGYNGMPNETPDPHPAVWSYAFEDTPLGDYDMNDVVIKVSYAYDENTKKVDNSHLNVTLCCTGATLKLKVYLNETALFGGEEVHEALGRTAPELVNTGVGPDTGTNTVTIKTPDNFEFGTADFWIDSPLVRGGVHVAKEGQDPHGIVIPADWAWPTEYTCIKDAYPNFIEFAKDASTKDEAILNWYKQTPVAGKTYKK